MPVPTATIPSETRQRLRNWLEIFDLTENQIETKLDQHQRDRSPEWVICEIMAVNR